MNWKGLIHQYHQFAIWEREVILTVQERKKMVKSLFVKKQTLLFKLSKKNKKNKKIKKIKKNTKNTKNNK